VWSYTYLQFKELLIIIYSLFILCNYFLLCDLRAQARLFRADIITVTVPTESYRQPGQIPGRIGIVNYL